ncbi:hypothetical protein ROZALSC1DRAFT_25768, partial [Rozella allomycis CSF55]
MKKIATLRMIKSGVSSYLIDHNPEIGFEKTWNPIKQEGNPALCKSLTVLLKDINRLQIKAGKLPKSKRALSLENMKSLYRYLESLSHTKPHTAYMFQWLYIVMFLCCLRFDEARSLRFEWASMPIGLTNYFELRLPFRKTNQDGK